LFKLAEHRNKGALVFDQIPAEIRIRLQRTADGKCTVDVVVVHCGHGDLLQVVDALSPPGGLAGRLHGGQEQGDENRDDSDDDQQFDQGESPPEPSSNHDLTPC